jgi:hypothetical protein
VSGRRENGNAETRLDRQPRRDRHTHCQSSLGPRCGIRGSVRAGRCPLATHPLHHRSASDRRARGPRRRLGRSVPRRRGAHPYREVEWLRFRPPGLRISGRERCIRRALRGRGSRLRRPPARGTRALRQQDQGTLARTVARHPHRARKPWSSRAGSATPSCSRRRQAEAGAGCAPCRMRKR